MATSYEELLVELRAIESELPDRDAVDWLYCDFYNQTLNTFAKATGNTSVLFNLITEAHLKAFRPSPQSEIVYVCARNTFLMELNSAIEYCEQHI